jgi:hypothetical protein
MKKKLIIIFILLALIGFSCIEQKRENNFKDKEIDFPTSFKKVQELIPWEGRDSQSVFVFKDKIWLIGGVSGNDHIYNKRIIDIIADKIRDFKKGENNIIHSPYYTKYNESPHFNDIWSSEDGVNWTNMGNTPWIGRRSMSIVLFKDKLWAMAGFNPSEGCKNDIWSSEDGVNWTKVLDNAPWEAREGQAVEVFNNKLWIMGGVNYGTDKTMNDVWSSEDGVNWIESVAPWPSRWDHASAVFDNKIFLTGGMDLNNNMYNDEWYFDGNNWTLVSAPWQKRQGHALLEYENKLWLIGRLNDFESKGDNDIWISDNGFNWNKFNEQIPWTGREDFEAAVFKDKIWILGGMDSNWYWRNDVWYLELKK